MPAGVLLGGLAIDVATGQGSSPAETSRARSAMACRPSRGRLLDLVRMGVGVQGIQLLPGQPAAGRDPQGGVDRRPAMVGAPC